MHNNLQESEDEHEPDSTHDENDDVHGSDAGGTDVSDLFDGADDDPSLDDPNNSSRRDSSLTSLGSQQSTCSLSVFKKIPSLNKVFVKPNKTTSICKPCGKELNTVEYHRLLTHLKLCPKMDSATKLEFSDEHINVVTKKLKTKSTKDAKLNELWARFMVDNNVALRCAESKSFKNFISEATPGWKSANRKTYSSFYIPAMSNSIKDTLTMMIRQHGDDFVALEFDHWTDINGRSFLGIVFSFPSGNRYLKTLEDVSLVGHSAEMTIPYVKRALKSLPSYSINSIVSDSDSACRLTRELIVGDQDFKRVIQHRCMAHLFNRMGNLFDTGSGMKKVNAWASRVTLTINKVSRLGALLRERECRKPKSACPTRWYSTINMLESLLESKSEILQSLNELPKGLKLSWINNETYWKMIDRAIVIMRPLIDCIAISERKDGSLGEAVSSLLRYARDIMESDWNDPLKLEAVSAFLVYFGPAKLGIDEFGLMLTAYALDRRNKCDYLTEEGLDLVFKTLTNLLNKSGLASPNINQVLLQEFTLYSMLGGQFSREQPEDQQALDWWAEISSCSTLKILAARIARLRSSSANIERTFSTLRLIQGTRRANLSIETLVHLTRIKIFDNDELCHDYSNEGDTSMTTGYDQQLAAEFEDQPTIDELDNDRDAAISVSPTRQGPEPDQSSTSLNLLTYEARDLFDSFRTFIDFSITNEPTRTFLSASTELSDEQTDLLVLECRKMRQELREKSKSQSTQSFNE